MEQLRKSALLLATALLTAAMPTCAKEAGSMQDPRNAAATTGACHGLMTEQECADFQSTLATLPKGQAREQFLAAHLTLMRERESVCSCSRYMNRGEVVYPRVRQVARRF